MEKLVNVIMGEKLWSCSRKMAKQIIGLAKEKYKKENVNAIVAVEKNGTITLLKDVYDSAEEMLDEVTKWTKGKYNVYYITKQKGGN